MWHVLNKNITIILMTIMMIVEVTGHIVKGEILIMRFFVPFPDFKEEGYYNYKAMYSTHSPTVRPFQQFVVV